MSYEPHRFPEALRDYGLTVVEWPGWLGRGRFPYDPFAQMTHHDGFAEPFADADAARWMASVGSPAAPAPCANGAIGNFSTVYLLAAGKANHAGVGLASVADRVRLGLAPLRDAAEAGTWNGNGVYWGWECRNAGDGHDPWDQLDAMERAHAAIADVTGWGCDRIVAHREHTKRKPDPLGFDMHAYRADCHLIRFLHNTEDDMPLTNEDAVKVAEYVWKQRQTIDFGLGPVDNVPLAALYAALISTQQADHRTAAILAAVQGDDAAMQQLEQAVAVGFAALDGGELDDDTIRKLARAIIVEAATTEIR